MEKLQRVKGCVRAVAIAAVAAVGSVSAFAQSSGSTTPAFSDTAILASINGVAPVILDVGGAVLAIVVMVFGFKVVKGFVSR